VGISDVSSRTFSQPKWSRTNKQLNKVQEILNYLGKLCRQYYLIVEDG
jgi:hypothetical protein